MRRASQKTPKPSVVIEYRMTWRTQMTGQFWTYVRYAALFTAVCISSMQDALKRERAERAERANALAAAQLNYPNLDQYISQGRISLGR
jgi:hypothetical protein